MSAKELRRLSNGRFEAVCGKCLTWSPSVAAVDQGAAWSEIQTLGWSTNADGWPYAVCPKCTANPRTVEEIAAGVQRRRRKK